MALFLRGDDVAKDKVRTSKFLKQNFLIFFRWFEQENKKFGWPWTKGNIKIEFHNLIIIASSISIRNWLTVTIYHTTTYQSFVHSSHEYTNSCELIIDGPNRWTFMIKTNQKSSRKTQHKKTKAHAENFRLYWVFREIIFIYLSEENNCCDSAIPIYFIFLFCFAIKLNKNRRKQIFCCDLIVRYIVI